MLICCPVHTWQVDITAIADFLVRINQCLIAGRELGDDIWLNDKASTTPDETTDDVNDHKGYLSSQPVTLFDKLIFW